MRTKRVTKKEKIARLKTKLREDQGWAIDGLMELHGRQSFTERICGVTSESNGRGFTAFDAEILSSFASQHFMGRRLTWKQLKALHKLMPKYAKQLLEFFADMLAIEREYEMEEPEFASV